MQEPTDTNQQPFRTRYLVHVTGYQPIRDQYFLVTGKLGAHYMIGVQWNEGFGKAIFLIEHYAI